MCGGVCAGSLEHAHQPSTGLFLVYPRSLFNMGPAYMFSRDVETLTIDGYLTLVLLTHGNLTAFHRLKKYGEPLSVRKAHASVETYSYKCAAGQETLLLLYLLMQNRYLTGEERNLKTREEMREANGGISFLTDMCLAMRSDPLEKIRGLGEVVTYVYGPVVMYAFPDPLVTAHRHSVVYVSLISTLNWCKQEGLRAQVSETVLFGSEGSRNNSAQLQGPAAAQDGGKRKGPIEAYPKFWNLNPVARNMREVMRIPAWKKSFEFMKKELETILEWYLLPAVISEFPTVRTDDVGNE